MTNASIFQVLCRCLNSGWDTGQFSESKWELHILVKHIVNLVKYTQLSCTAAVLVDFDERETLKVLQGNCMVVQSGSRSEKPGVENFLH